MNSKTHKSDSALISKKCVPCNSSVPPMDMKKAASYMDAIPGWSLVENKKIQKTYVLSDFREAISFLNSIAELAEAEGHHPDLCLYYNKLEATLWTHKINGLHENDFIMAAKIDNLYNKKQGA